MGDSDVPPRVSASPSEAPGSPSASAPAPPSTSAPASPFDSRSEAGRALAGVDWAATELGPWEQWPISLSTAVRMMLGSRFSMCMLYGDQSIFLCNDAYRLDSLGDKFPWALGKPMSLVWPEVWDVASERIRSVVVDGVATWDAGLRLFLERSGYTEETYHTFSYGPLHDESGAVAGVLCVVVEETLKVLADRRMALLRDFGAALTAATTRDGIALAAHAQLSGENRDVSFAVAYLVDPDLALAPDGSPNSLELYWSAGSSAGDPATPRRLTPATPHPWAETIFSEDDGSRVVTLDPTMPWPLGSWPDPPTHAAVLPLRQVAQHAPYGYLVVGLNPYRAFDLDYRGFVELLADQLANALARAEAFEQERDRHAQLAELDRAKTTFFTNISHELRTPLTLLLGPAEDALTDIDNPLDGPQRTRFEVVARNGARLLKLVNTLLDFSRLEAGRAGARYEQLDLAGLTRELTTMFEASVTRAGLRLDVDVSPLAQRPYVDREMWAKIVLNLVSNALKATFAGSITVSLRDDPGIGAVLEVTDTGVGIPADEVERLFERFHRVAGARQRSHEGSGIGLALVSELVRLHGGTIEVQSKPGLGSTFAVRVPYGLAHLPADEIVDLAAAADPDSVIDVSRLGAGYVAESLRWSAAPETADESSSSASPETEADLPSVLVVDDSADVRDYVRGLLTGDYHVRVAADGERALEQVRAETPDLVITDVMMPVLDGFGLLAALRADPDLGHIPVIMLSARSGDTAAVEGLEAGADDYLVKPFAARELRARVRANLELDRARQLLSELQRSRDMLDNAERLAQLGSWEIDLRKLTMRASPQLARTTGLDLGDRMPVPVREGLTIAAPEHEDLVRDAVLHAVENGTDLDIEVWAQRPGGERYRAHIRGVVVPGTDGAAHYLRGSTQDVTRQRAAEAELAEAHALREVAAREHVIASELQRSLLPDQDFEHSAAAQLEVAAYYRAGVEGTQVGGDWYDVIDLGMGRTAVVIGDVMGRGVRAAAVMGQLRAAARAYSRLSLPPDEVLRLLDDTVREVGPDTIVTCVYAVYDPAEQTLDYANAGHLPPLLHTPDGRVTRLDSGGPPLGAGRHAEIGTQVPFTPGTTLVLYTDGLVERRGGDLDARIELLATEVARTGRAATDEPVPVADLPAAIVDLLLRDQTDDDVALLICRGGVREPGDRHARYRPGTDERAVGAARGFVLDTLRAWEVSGTADYDLQLAVSELVTNAINHGSPPVEVHLRLSGNRLRMSVRDGGDGRPVVRRSGPEETNGRGLLIVATLADAWGIEGGTTGKTVWCEFTLPELGAVDELAS